MGNASSLLSTRNGESNKTIIEFVRSMDMVSPENMSQISGLKVKTSITNIAVVTPGDLGHFRYWLLQQINVFMFTYPADGLQVPLSHYLKHKFKGTSFITICLEPSLFQAMALFMENVYDFLTQYEFLEKVIEVQDTLDSMLNQYVGPRLRAPKVRAPAIRCCVPVDPSLFVDEPEPYNTSDGIEREKEKERDEPIGMSSFVPPVSEPMSVYGETSFAPPISEPLSMDVSSFAPPVSEPLSMDVSSFAPAISEPSSMDVSSFAPPVSEPSSMDVSSFAPAISEPSSIADGSSSSFLPVVSEPSMTGTGGTSSSIMLPMSEPSSIDNGTSLETSVSSVSRSSRSSKRSAKSKSRSSKSAASQSSAFKSEASQSSALKLELSSASKTSEFGAIAESSTGDSELFKSARRTRHQVLEMSGSESESISVSSSFASRAGKRKAPLLELSEDDKEFLSEVSGKSVEEAVRDFYRDGEKTAKQRKRNTRARRNRD